MALWIGDSPHCLYFLFLASSCGSHPVPGMCSALCTTHSSRATAHKWLCFEGADHNPAKLRPPSAAPLCSYPRTDPVSLLHQGFGSFPVYCHCISAARGGFLVQKASPIVLTSPAPSSRLPLAPGPGVFILLCLVSLTLT